MTDSIHDLMDRWSRYRRTQRLGGFGKTILQRMMEGVPGTGCPTCGTKGRVPGSLVGSSDPFVKCPTCGGAGRVPLDANDYQEHIRDCPHCYVRRPGEKKGRSMGEVNGRTCIPCRGTGKLTHETDKVNPAFITSTYVEPDHPTYQRIDRLVCEFRRRPELLGYWFVIDAEYCDHRGGTQAIKAERLWITPDNYRKRLQRALEWIEASLADGRPCTEIPFPYAQKKKVFETLNFA